MLHGAGRRIIPFMRFTDDPDLRHNQEFSARMALKGVYLHPHHNWFLSWARKEPDIDETIEKAAAVFKEVRKAMGDGSAPVRGGETGVLSSSNPEYYQQVMKRILIVLLTVAAVAAVVLSSSRCSVTKHGMDGSYGNAVLSDVNTVAGAVYCIKAYSRQVNFKAVVKSPALITENRSQADLIT